MADEEKKVEEMDEDVLNIIHEYKNRIESLEDVVADMETAYELEVQERVAEELEKKLEESKTNRKHEFGDDKENEESGYKGLTRANTELLNVIMKGAERFNPMISRSEELKAAVKSMTSTGSGSGDEWVPTGMAAQLWEEWQEQTLIRPLFREINMPTNPYDIPANLSDPTVYKVAENAAPPASDEGTQKMTLTAVKLAAKVNFTEELVEDSIIPILPEVRSSIAQAMANAVDAVIVNGDTTTGTANISYYGSSITSTHRYLVFDGLRHQGLVDNTACKADLGALAAADYQSLMSLVGKYATRPSGCAFIEDIYTYLKCLAIDEFETVDKYGPSATIMNGELGKIYGIPIIITEELGKTDSSGYINATAASNTVGSIVLVHKNSWLLGFKRQLDLELDRDADKDAYNLYARIRIALMDFGTSSSATHTATGYNVTV